MQVPYSHFEELLNEKGLTSYRLAKDLGFSTVLFTHWKNGRSAPKMEKLNKIAEYLNVPVSYFFDGKVDNTTYEEKKGEAKSLLGDLTPEEIKKVQEYIVFLKSQRKK